MRAAKVILVYGPPASGKSTWVEEHREPGDYVWDWDAVLQTVTKFPSHERSSTMDPLVLSLRDAFYRWVITHPEFNRTIYIIESVPTRAERKKRFQQLGCKFTAIVTPIEICKERARQRPSSDKWMQAIDYWFSQYEPDEVS